MYFLSRSLVYANIFLVESTGLESKHTSLRVRSNGVEPNVLLGGVIGNRCFQTCDFVFHYRYSIILRLHQILLLFSSSTSLSNHCPHRHHAAAPGEIPITALWTVNIGKMPWAAPFNLYCQQQSREGVREDLRKQIKSCEC